MFSALPEKQTYRRSPEEPSPRAAAAEVHRAAWAEGAHRAAGCADVETREETQRLEALLISGLA
jgi:hypothetical protein